MSRKPPSLPADSPAVTLARDAVVWAAVLAVVAATLFAVSGVWPPMVAVESGSMAPSLRTGDLVVASATDRQAAASADPAGVVTRQAADGYRRLGAPGDVVVFSVPGVSASPIIHRARFHVSAGENRYPRADPSAFPASVEGCGDVPQCPAPHAGSITKGDANTHYDQAAGVPPVRPRWVEAKAQVRVPWLGWIRLAIAGATGG